MEDDINSVTTATEEQEQEEEKEQGKMPWNDIITALETTHQTTTRTICQNLRADRKWVAANIVPLLADKKIQLGNGYGSRPWARIAYNQIYHHKGMSIGNLAISPSERSYYCTDDYLQMVYSHCTYTQQTKLIPIEYLLDPTKIRTAKIEYNDIKRRIDDTVPYFWEKYVELKAKLHDMWTPYLSGTGQYLWDRQVNPNRQRSKVPAISMPSPWQSPAEINFDGWRSAHDIKHYGDTDEEVYRYLFATAKVRIELSIPYPPNVMDGDITKTQKIYYIDDPWALPVPKNAIGYNVLVSVSDYQDNKNIMDSIARQYIENIER